MQPTPSLLTTKLSLLTTKFTFLNTKLPLLATTLSYKHLKQGYYKHSKMIQALAINLGQRDYIDLLNLVISVLISWWYVELQLLFIITL